MQTITKGEKHVVENTIKYGDISEGKYTSRQQVTLLVSMSKVQYGAWHTAEAWASWLHMALQESDM